jgi:hypothetical protein
MTSRNRSEMTKRQWTDEQAKRAEEAAKTRNLKELYDTTRVLSRKKYARNKPVKGTDGNLITGKEEQAKKWTEHFKEILNRNVEEDEEQGQEEDQEEVAGMEGREGIEKEEENEGQDKRILKINIGTPTLEEVKKAIKQLRNGKAPGIGNISPDILTADVDTTAKLLYPLIMQIWKEQKYPTERNEGTIIKLPKKEIYQTVIIGEV